VGCEHAGEKAIKKKRNTWRRGKRPYINHEADFLGKGLDEKEVGCMLTNAT
jgi:hypothetical protein